MFCRRRLRKYFDEYRMVHTTCQTGKWRFVLLTVCTILKSELTLGKKVMAASLGDSWRDNFFSFDAIPFAAASIGQVHRAELASAVSPTGRNETVAVKIQFPNIGQSVDSDIGYLKVLLTAGQLLPKGLFLDKTITVSDSRPMS